MMAKEQHEEKTVLEANTVFLLMKKGFPISRNVRAQWLLQHLESIIDIQQNVTNDEAAELEIVSILPYEAGSTWSIDTCHQFLYKITSNSTVIFLAHKYRMVFSLDLSPSLATADIQHGEIVIDEVLLATKRFLENIIRPFTVPGSSRLMKPDIYITVVAHTSFVTSPAQQVLIQGWLLTTENVGYLVQLIENQLNLLEEKVAVVTATANQELEKAVKANEDFLGEDIFIENSTCLDRTNSNCTANTSIISPEASLINMLRYGMLALTLLPEHSCSHLIVVTDGIIGATNIHVLDSIIHQLRSTTVACSFLHIGSPYHPHCGDGLIPYQDLLYFLATATLGSYMPFIPNSKEANILDMNIYHRNFLCWQLYRQASYETCQNHQSSWTMENSLFHGHKSTQLLRKKHFDDKVTCSLSSLLCCRLREGYLMKRAVIRDEMLEITFVLLWKSNVFLEYLVTCPWSAKSLSMSNTITYIITIEAPYEFLHDITCLSKKPLKSLYRRNVVTRFWSALTSLTESDNMLAHFSWFPSSGWTWYSVPDTVRSGMPVFYLSAYPSPSAVQLSDAACPQFGQIWQPVVSLDPLQWSRWMHAQRVTLVLSHDRPLPRHLHQANQSGRFQCVQSRQAAAVLYAMLKTWATFVLVENHTYVQFIYREAEKPPVSFSLIRISSKALCVVLNIAFAGGTEGVVRHNVVADLAERLSKLTLPNRPTEQRETPCCTIIHKSLERILIRYERMPGDLSMVIFPDGTQPTPTRSMLVTGGSLTTTTLSRYLYHNRWLWYVRKPLVQTIPGITLPRLSIAAIARILSTVTRMRLTEGFNFAYSAAGIINMVSEVQMQNLGNSDVSYPCMIQYIVFPPHVVANAPTEHESASDDDTDEGTADGEISIEDGETTGDFQIVTEIWIEPQCGYALAPTQRQSSFMHGLQYHQLSEAFAKIDGKSINALLTLEYLSLLSQVTPTEKSSEIIYGQSFQGGKFVDLSGPRHNEHWKNSEFFEGPPIMDERIHPMYFSFDILSVLPKCQLAELLFSMFANDADCGEGSKESANRMLMEGFLEHIKRLHNKELLLTSAESKRFTEMLAKRPREEGSPFLPFFSQGEKYQEADIDSHPCWRCYVKGVSTSHVIVTILPASERDVQLLMNHGSSRSAFSSNNSEQNYESEQFLRETIDITTASPGSQSTDLNTSEDLIVEIQYVKEPNVSDPIRTGLKKEVTINHYVEKSREGLIIPVYVCDCSLALLIDALIDKSPSPRNKDIYRDYTFRIGQEENIDFINLRAASNCSKPPSPEPKSEDSDNIAGDQRSLMEHCKLISLAHCNCYVVTVYKSLALQQHLSYEDMEAAVEQCKETVIEINVTKYLRTVCRHLSTANNDAPLSNLKECTCTHVRPLHSLIKDKFEQLMTVAFRPVPAHPEFYYCSPSWSSDRMELMGSDSDDDLEDFTFHSENIDFKLDTTSSTKVNQANASWPVTNHQNVGKLSGCTSTESLASDLQEEMVHGKDQPLFLQLSCSVHSSTGLYTIPVKLLPTCFLEIIDKMDDMDKDAVSSLSVENLKITLDIICLNLPREVLEVSLERHSKLRSTSYCSASPRGSVRTESDGSPGNEIRTEPLPDKMSHLPVFQHHAIGNLTDEIEWLLQDETATALLDKPIPTEDTLAFVAKHVSNSPGRPSCLEDKVPLHFVFNSESSGPKFLEELRRLQIDNYCLLQEGSLFYIGKKRNQKDTDQFNKDTGMKSDLNIGEEAVGENWDSLKGNRKDDATGMEMRTSRQDSGDPPGCYSEISSIGEGKPGTDDGYDGDSSNSEDDLHWLSTLDQRRNLLPNFWLILKVDNNLVNTYFHCRFLELSSPEIENYWRVQKQVIVQIKAMCRRVNQYLLLQNLHDTRICDPLLESESSEDHISRQEVNCESIGSFQSQNSVINLTPGMFRCPIVWEVPFCLHPRLKTGPERSGLSRGTKALQGVLNRFSVNNRTNMFVYQENNQSVFYLRLQEQSSDGKSLQNKLSESDEKLVVSRSSSVASLSQAKGSGSINDSMLITDTRPRVRSFGEKESDILSKTGDSIVLMVHGISEAGPAVKQDLVQVLQNRLDDAVLDVLSIMLARNPMCKLTPVDVHFIQKPYRSPERIVKLTVPSHCLPYVGSLGYYIRQNLLQFLYTPKYTDPRAHYHFQDYSQPEDSVKRVSESDIFLYNQSHSSGSKGIACIASAITNPQGEPIEMKGVQPDTFTSDFPNLNFQDIVSTTIYDSRNDEEPPEALIEFRIWKQGRVNFETLIQKLRLAVKHAVWDLVTEYNLLSLPLTKSAKIANEVENFSTNNDNNYDDNDDKAMQQKIDDEENGEEEKKRRQNSHEEGILREIYYPTLTSWFQFALEMGVSSVKKHEICIHRRHPIAITVREFQSLIRSHSSDTTCQSFIPQTQQPFLQSSFDRVCPGLNQNHNESTVYVSYDFNNDDHHGAFTKCLLIARNSQLWTDSYSKSVESELLVPKEQKVLQKFNPLILESSFVPRQRILLAEIDSDRIKLYMYNWSKEKSEKLIKQTTSLGNWLSSRSSLFTNIIMQKLGIFHHQPMQTDSFHQRESIAPQYYQISDMECLAKFPHSDSKEAQRFANRSQSIKNNAYSWNHSIGQAMRDAKPNFPHNNTNSSDPIVRAACHLQDLRHREKRVKEDLSRLYAMWQIRSTSPNIPISSATLNTFKQYSRMIHFCHTPVLFLPSWRLQSAATRDHSLTPSTPPAANLLQQNSQQSNTKNKENLKWHQELCNLMFSEYKQYLQTLGFNPIQIDCPMYRSDEQCIHNQTHYLKKSMLGGILLFEIHLSEPFFIVKLHIIECSRLQVKNSSIMANQFVLSFVDTCDKIKINMHLHSFTYDFHLRCIHSYIAENGSWSLQHGYHLAQFLDDFNKYYSKAPNFARNLIYNDVITIENLVTPARTLYTYLLQHEKTYGMRVLVMSGETEEKQNGEHVLVRLQSTPLIRYRDAQDAKCADDFDVALVVSRLEQSIEIEKTEITLKYYLMLTSKRELYPQKEVENNKLGKFRTVYSLGNTNNDSLSGSSSALSGLQKTKELSTDDLTESSVSYTKDEKGPSNAPVPPPVPTSPLSATSNNLNSNPTSTHLVEIRQESINYLGYYSSHEQLMQQMMMTQAQVARHDITDMIKRGASQCRTHLLWNKLLESKSSMAYTEFMELCSLAHVESLSKLDPRLSPLVNQPISWYQALSKILQNKYQECHKQFNTPDGNITHHLILHPRFLQAFMMLTIDLHTSRGELCAVYQKSVGHKPYSMEDVYDLIEGFVNACCFHLWIGLCTQ
ncbi:KICSTOR complex protein SZT2-like [Prorops nasuta]|uniref:KICSTOR complex protein SZT2-like n=1 Tax=Prorops nasuta TaxID=863751 RepID=UPI0034CD794C